MPSGPNFTLRAGVEGVEFFAGLEPDGFAWRDADLGAGAGVAADAGFAWTDTEDAEAAQFDAFAGRESFFETLEDRIDSGFGLGSRQACPLNDVMDNILFDHFRRPLME